MQLWKAILTYDGTPFHGWQVQPGLLTVQGTLRDALFRLTGERVLPQGSGRTDTGVHALGQVASFPLEAPIPAANLHQALNRLLPSSIRILSIEPAVSGFHARHSARRKTYEYRIFASRMAGRDPTATGEEAGRRICSPMIAPYVWDCPVELRMRALEEAAQQVVGTHDFTSFAAVDPELSTDVTGRSAERTVFASGWREMGELLVYEVTGTGFLHHMVRNLVGTFVECGCGRMSPERIAGILEARDRSAAGRTAPARGLFLMSVEYT